MEDKRNFLNEMVTTSSNVTKKEEEGIEVFSGEDATINERKDDYLIRTNYDESQEYNMEKEQINTVINGADCELNELFDISAVIYNKYAEYKSYLSIKGITPETLAILSQDNFSEEDICRYKLEIDKATPDNNKIAEVVKALLTMYDPSNIVMVLKGMLYYELADLIYDQNIEAFNRYFDDQNVESKLFYIRLSKKYNNNGYDSDSEFDD